MKTIVNKTFLAVCTCLLSLSALGQDTQNAYQKALDQIFSGISSEKITTGILIERAPSFVDMYRYEGVDIALIDTCNVKKWKQMVLRLNVAHLDSRFFGTPKYGSSNPALRFFGFSAKRRKHQFRCSAHDNLVRQWFERSCYHFDVTRSNGATIGLRSSQANAFVPPYCYYRYDSALTSDMVTIMKDLLIPSDLVLGNRTIHAGQSVCYEVPGTITVSDNFIVESGGRLELRAERIVLNPGFKAESGASVSINPNPPLICPPGTINSVPF